MKEIFVPQEIAVKLKEIGFDEPCIFHYYKDEVLIDLTDYVERQYVYFEEIEFSNHNNYDNQISAPTWEQAFKWFREKGLYGYIDHTNNSKMCIYEYSIVNSNDIEYFDEDLFHQAKSFWSYEYSNFEECREALVLKMIEIYEEKNENISRKITNIRETNQKSTTEIDRIE